MIFYFNFFLFTSIAVLYVCILTDNGSQIPYCFISTILPLSPFTPHVELPSCACLALNAVNVRITLAPQFCINVRGITSNDLANARKGH